MGCFNREPRGPCASGWSRNNLASHRRMTRSLAKDVIAVLSNFRRLKRGPSWKCTLLIETYAQPRDSMHLDRSCGHPLLSHFGTRVVLRIKLSLCMDGSRWILWQQMNNRGTGHLYDFNFYPIPKAGEVVGPGICMMRGD